MEKDNIKKEQAKKEKLLNMEISSAETILRKEAKSSKLNMKYELMQEYADMNFTLDSGREIRIRARYSGFWKLGKSVFRLVEQINAMEKIRPHSENILIAFSLQPPISEIIITLDLSQNQSFTIQTYLQNYLPSAIFLQNQYIPLQIT